MYDPDAEMCRSVEGSEEWSFFQTFRPACFESASGPQSTLGSTRANSLEERETKSARIQDHKGAMAKVHRIMQVVVHRDRRERKGRGTVKVAGPRMRVGPPIGGPRAAPHRVSGLR